MVNDINVLFNYVFFSSMTLVPNRDSYFTTLVINCYMLFKGKSLNF